MSNAKVFAMQNGRLAGRPNTTAYVDPHATDMDSRKQQFCAEWIGISM